MKNKIMLVICTTIFYTGCSVPTLKGEYIPEEMLTEIHTEKNMSWVIGKLEISTEHHSTISGIDVDKFRKTYMVVQRKEGEYTKWLKSYYDEWFIWKLYPGEYTISSIWINKNLFIEPTPFSFLVPEPGKIYYIGNIDVKVNIEYIERDTRYETRYKIISANIMNSHDDMIEHINNTGHIEPGMIRDSILYRNSDNSIELGFISIYASKYKDLHNSYEIDLPVFFAPFGGFHF